MTPQEEFQDRVSHYWENMNRYYHANVGIKPREVVKKFLEDNLAFRTAEKRFLDDHDLFPIRCGYFDKDTGGGKRIMRKADHMS